MSRKYWVKSKKFKYRDYYYKICWDLTEQEFIINVYKKCLCFYEHKHWMYYKEQKDSDEVYLACAHAAAKNKIDEIMLFEDNLSKKQKLMKSEFIELSSKLGVK